MVQCTSEFDLGGKFSRLRALYKNFPLKVDSLIKKENHNNMCIVVNWPKIKVCFSERSRICQVAYRGLLAKDQQLDRVKIASVHIDLNISIVTTNIDLNISNISMR